MFARSPKELAMLVVNQRKKLKLSQAEVGQLVGLKQQTISDFENKPERTQLRTVFRIFSALNLDIKVMSKDEKSDLKTGWKEEW